VAEARRSNEVKTGRKPKTRAKGAKRVKSRISIDLIDIRLQLVMTYVYIGSKTQLFGSDTTNLS
jgi:hypothetical protein